MKKIVFICLAALLFSGTLKSTNNNAEKAGESVATFSISGQVLDHDSGESLAGVRVKVDGAEASSYTDFEGNFLIQGLMPASYIVSLTLISYEEAKLTVDLGADDPKDEIRVSMEQIAR